MEPIKITCLSLFSNTLYYCSLVPSLSCLLFPVWHWHVWIGHQLQAFSQLKASCACFRVPRHTDVFPTLYVISICRWHWHVLLDRVLELFNHLKYRPLQLGWWSLFSHNIIIIKMTHALLYIYIYILWKPFKLWFFKTLIINLFCEVKSFIITFLFLLHPWTMVIFILLPSLVPGPIYNGIP